MISFDFEYYRPDTIEEACSIHDTLTLAGKIPFYYAGGTEIITLARANQFQFQAVIDLKAIPECNSFTITDQEIFIGAAITLSQICDINFFPLLTETAKKIADRTSRNQITLGGNICGMIPYKEAVLPLLIADAKVVIAGSQGTRTMQLMEVFNQKLNIRKEEFLLQFILDPLYTTLPYKIYRKTRQGELSYPLATIAAIKKDEKIRCAFSGLCSFPFRSKDVEKELNNMIADNEKIAAVLTGLPQNLISDQHGSAEYREFVLTNALKEILTTLGGEN